MIPIFRPLARIFVAHGMTDAPLLPSELIMLANSAPLYERPWVETPKPRRILAEWVPPPNSILDCLEDIVGHPQGCSRRWIWEQYDHMVMGDTIQRPGGNGRKGRSSQQHLIEWAESRYREATRLKKRKPKGIAKRNIRLS